MLIILLSVTKVWARTQHALSFGFMLTAVRLHLRNQTMYLLTVSFSVLPSYVLWAYFINGKGQTRSFSEVIPQHQNARGERAIQTMMYMTRIFMALTQLHWIETDAYAIYLWSSAAKYLVWMYNQMPNKELGLTTLENLTRNKYEYLQHPTLLCVELPFFSFRTKATELSESPKMELESSFGSIYWFFGWTLLYSDQRVKYKYWIYFSTVLFGFNDLFETVIY